MRAKPTSNYGSDAEQGSANRTFLIGGHVLNAPKPVPGLYLVATPIGHLGDITLRALETLAGVDIIACEDTRITRRLTERYAISAELKPYHEHNAAMARPKILEKLAQGASIALVSDAGTPLISDPGFKLVREVCAAGHAVIAVPGASSVLTALSVAALPTDRFFFEGFLPPKHVARRTRLAELARIDATLVMFESGNRVQETLADLAETMAGRDAAICRELTKLHEEIKRAPITELAKAAGTLETRGEFVLVVGPPRADANIMTQHDLDDLLRSSLARDSVKDSATPPDASAKVAAPARVAAFRTGLSAENRAAALLVAKGYRILAKRFRTPHGEIDLVARKRNLIAFIEVKARASLDDAAYAVTPRQQARIIDAAQGWLMAHPEHAEFELRFDAILIAPRRLPRHLLAAFDASA
jgi:16S rRNA (cytidine1402-2'-O)-methyltransferase